jgi:serine/threonine-protein kinase HipA
MTEKVNIYLFAKHIATMYEDNDRVYLKQIDNLAHQASPLSIGKNIMEIETTHLEFFRQSRWVYQ